MSCCQCQGIESFFNKKLAFREIKQYREKGPTKTTKILIEALKTEEIEGMTLLDIGGGIGAIQYESLEAGVRSATNVEASTAYIEVAQEEAYRHGYSDRVDYHHGDFVDLAPEIDPADIVTLDRVICCYHDMETLVGLSSVRARKLYGLVYPRDTWWIKIARPVINLFFWVQRNPFRFFLHPTEAVESLVRKNGLEPHFYRKTAIWQVVVYRR